MPTCAPRPVPTSSAVGVARPSAQGQAMINTATAAVKASVAGCPRASQTPRVTSAIPITTGTNTAETRSARRWTRALPLWASVTSRAMRASCVSAPTRVARTTSRPPAFTVAPTTASPGATSTGTDSPVTMLASTADSPSSTTPSVAIFSPGRTTNSSPIRSASTGIRSSTRRGPVPRAPSAGRSRSTVTSFAPRWSSARRAAPERRRARDSRNRPVSRNTVTPAATSR